MTVQVSIPTTRCRLGSSLRGGKLPGMYCQCPIDCSPVDVRCSAAHL